MKKHVRKFQKSLPKVHDKKYVPLPDENRRIAQETRNIVTWASGLVERGLASWMKIQMPDGSGKIVLCFPSEKWDIIDGRLTFKEG